MLKYLLYLLHPLLTNCIWIILAIGLFFYILSFRTRTVQLFMEWKVGLKQTTAVLTYPTSNQKWIGKSLEVVLSGDDPKTDEPPSFCRPTDRTVIPFYFEAGNERISIPFRPGQTVRLAYDDGLGRYIAVGEQTDRYRIYLSNVD